MDKNAHHASVLRLQKEGLSQSAIARDLGISRQRVWQLLHRQGLAGSGKPPAEQRRAKMPALLRQGLSNAQIGKRLGVTSSTIVRDLSTLPDREALLEARRLAKPSWHRRALVPDLIRQGMATPDIARHLGVGTSTAQRDVKALALTKALERKRLANAKATQERKRLEAMERRGGPISRPQPNS
jgi:transposase